MVFMQPWHCDGGSDTDKGEASRSNDGSMHRS
jgi:hypothetical protein